MSKEHVALAVSAYVMTDNEIDDWISDPYMTVEIINIKTKEQAINKTAHIYFNRAEYKKINPNTDLIFDQRMWEAFNSMMVYTDTYNALCNELNGAMDRLNKKPVNIEFMPCYLYLPYIETKRKSIVSFFTIPRGEL